MTDLTKFIKKVKDEYALGGFEGCWYTRLSGKVFLVFACGDEEEGLKGKIAYNCDDLQCDYDWDWKISSKYHWEENNCETHSAELIAKWVREVVEPSWLTAYRNFILEEYEEFSEEDEGDILNILFSTFDLTKGGEIEITVEYDPRKEEYHISTTDEDGVLMDFSIDTGLQTFKEDMETAGWQALYEYFVGEARSRLED